MTACARSGPRRGDGVVVAAVDQLHRRAVTFYRVDAAGRAVRGEQDHAPAAESLRESGDRASVIPVARGAQCGWAKAARDPGEVGEPDERVGWETGGGLHAFVERPRAPEKLERWKSEPVLLILHGDPGDLAGTRQLRHRDHRGRRISGHRAVK